MEIEELRICIRRIMEEAVSVEKEKQKAFHDLKNALKREDLKQQAYIYQRLFACCMVNKEIVDARYYKAYATQYANHLDEPALLLINHQLCGLFYLDEEEALEHYCKALLLAKQLEDHECEVFVLYHIANIFEKRNDPKAIDLYEKAKVMMNKQDNIYPFLMIHLFTLYAKTNTSKMTQLYVELHQITRFPWMHVYADILYTYYHHEQQPNAQLQILLENMPMNACDVWMLEECFEITLQTKDEKHAKQILMKLCECGSHDDIQQLLNIQSHVITFSETFPCAYDQTMLYQDYVHLSRKWMMKKDAQISHRYEEKLKYHELLAQNQILKQQASYDEVTKLRNRQRFQIDIEALMQRSDIASIGIAMCDIDNFKEYNDSYGHLFGDQIIRKIAEILQLHANDDIRVYRFGGDEFLCMFINVETSDINCYLTDVFLALEKLPQTLHISAGYTCLKTKDIHSLKEMIHHADTALYKAKNSGKNQFMEYVEQEA